MIENEKDLEKAVDEAIAEAPAETNFALDVEWKDGTNEQETAEAATFIKIMLEDIAFSPKERIPLCINKITIKRI
jgi:tartrate dehydratase alpha subunit/fumarate hydratase class I-like protein